MVKCSFSGKELPKGKGRMFIKNNGRIFYFINSKAMKNFLVLGRKPQKTKWTEAALKQKTLRTASKK